MMQNTRQTRTRMAALAVFLTAAVAACAPASAPAAQPQPAPAQQASSQPAPSQPTQAAPAPSQTAPSQPTQAAPAPIVPEKQAIKVGLPVTTSTFLPIYIAADDKLFGADGLEVEVVAFQGGTAMVQALIGGSVDIGVTSLAGVTAGISAGQPLKVIYGGFNMANFDWYALPEIKTLQDARGKVFGITTYGSSTDFLTRFALLAEGIDPENDVNIVQGGGSPGRLAAQEAGQIHVNIFAPPEKFMAADKGYNLVFSQRDLAPDYPFHVVFAHEDFIRNNPNTIRAFLRGLVRGIRVAKTDLEKSRATLIDRIKMDEKYVERTYRDFIDDIHEDGRLPSKEGMDFFFEMGMADGTFTERWPEEKFLVRTFMDTFDQWKP